MGGQDVLHDGESKACSALRTGPAAIHPVEALGDTADVFRSDADPVVRDGDLHEARRQGPGHQLDRSPRIVVLDRVVDQVGDDLPKALRVAEHGGEGVEARDGQAHVPGPGHRVQRFHDFAHQGLQRERGHLHLQFPRLDAGDFSKVPREVRQAVCVPQNLVEKRPVDRSVVDGAVEQGFGEAPDGEDGGLELVGYVAEELLPVILHLPQVPHLGLQDLARPVDLPHQVVQFVALRQVRCLEVIETMFPDLAQHRSREVDASPHDPHGCPVHADEVDDRDEDQQQVEPESKAYERGRQGRKDQSSRRELERHAVQKEPGPVIRITGLEGGLDGSTP